MEPELVGLIGNLGGVGLFAWLVYRLVERHLARVETHLERAAKANEDVGARLVTLIERQDAVRAEFTARTERLVEAIGELRSDVTPVETIRSGRYRKHRDGE